MSFHISRTLEASFDDAILRVVEALKANGFGVMTEIDVAKTLKAKLNKDFRPYRILGACKPDLAFEALSADDRIGVMLPCNVVAQQRDDGKVEISAIDPTATLGTVGNPALAAFAAKVRAMMQRVVDDV